MEILARYSRWKAVGLASFILMLAVVPNLPGFGRGLVVTWFYYTPSGTPIRLLLSSILMFGGLYLAGFALGIIVSTKAVWIEGKTLKWRVPWIRTLSMDDVDIATSSPARQVITIIRKSKTRKVEISTVFFKSRRDVECLLAHLPGQR